jgi:S1-C subfamily serine protease
VLVYSVAGGLAAERAGVRKDDLITFANNRPTRNLAEYRSVVDNSVGPILLQVRRRGGFKIMLTLHR